MYHSVELSDLDSYPAEVPDPTPSSPPNPIDGLPGDASKNDDAPSSENQAEMPPERKKFLIVRQWFRGGRKPSEDSDDIA